MVDDPVRLLRLGLSLVLKTSYPYRRETTPHPDGLKSIVLILGQTLIQIVSLVLVTGFLV